jgi:hypothetical protein
MPLLWGSQPNTYCWSVRKETTRERTESGTTKEVWTDGTEEMKRLIEYMKKLGL